MQGTGPLRGADTSLGPRRLPSSNPASDKRTPRRRRHAAAQRMRPLAITALVVLLLTTLGIALGPSLARGYAQQLQAQVTADFKQGQAEMEAGQAALKKATNDRDLKQLRAAELHFNAAGDRFQAARARVMLPRLVSVLPLVSPRDRARIGAAGNLADMGVSLAVVGKEASQVDGLLMEPSSTDLTGGARLISVLQATQPHLDLMRTELEAARSQAAAVDASVLTPAQQSILAKTRAAIDTGANGLQELAGLVPVLFEILGANGPRLYLVTQVNPAELRAGGGFIGSYSVLSADKGALKIVKGGDIGDVDYPRPNEGQPGYVAPPATLREFIGGKSWVLGDSNFFADFETNAKWAEFFSEREVKTKVDGVISVDPQAVADLLQVTGPIQVPGFNVTVQSSTFVQFLFEQQNGPQRQAGRKNFFDALAGPLLEKVASLPPTRWGDLVNTMNTTVAHRHVQVFFNDQAAEREMVRFGWSGSFIANKSADFMEEIESNFGATKANHFISRTYDVTLTRTSAGLHHQVRVTDLVDYNGQLTPEGYLYYRCNLRLLFPANATNASVAHMQKPDDYPDTYLPPGSQLLDGWFQINPLLRTRQGSWYVVFDYDTPWTVDTAGNHDLYWQKQPGTGNDQVNLTWEAPGHTYRASGDLAQDRIVRLSPAGVSLLPGQAGSARLPPLSL